MGCLVLWFTYEMFPETHVLNTSFLAIVTIWWSGGFFGIGNSGRGSRLIEAGMGRLYVPDHFLLSFLAASIGDCFKNSFLIPCSTWILTQGVPNVTRIGYFIIALVWVLVIWFSKSQNSGLQMTEFHSIKIDLCLFRSTNNCLQSRLDSLIWIIC